MYKYLHVYHMYVTSTRARIWYVLPRVASGGFPFSLERQLKSGAFESPGGRTDRLCHHLLNWGLGCGVDGDRTISALGVPRGARRRAEEAFSGAMGCLISRRLEVGGP